MLTEATIKRTPEEIKEAIAAASAKDRELNSTVYPADSLHAKGCKSPTCQYCVIRRFGDWLFGAAATPFIGGKEQALNRARTREYEHGEYPEAKVNNLYNLDGE